MIGSAFIRNPEYLFDYPSTLTGWQPVSLKPVNLDMLLRDFSPRYGRAA
jgi:hypothetical protein